MWAFTTLKDFRIAPCIMKIDMSKLLTLGMNNPVVAEEQELHPTTYGGFLSPL